MGTVQAQCLPDRSIATVCQAWSGMPETRCTASNSSEVDDLADIADAPLDAEALADALEPFFAQVADRHLLDVGVLEVDGDEVQLRTPCPTTATDNFLSVFIVVPA